MQRLALWTKSPVGIEEVHNMLRGISSSTTKLIELGDRMGFRTTSVVASIKRNRGIFFSCLNIASTSDQVINMGVLGHVG